MTEQIENKLAEFKAIQERLPELRKLFCLYVLNINLNMGLDNINLREDYTSFDILKILL